VNPSIWRRWWHPSATPSCGRFRAWAFRLGAWHVRHIRPSEGHAASLQKIPFAFRGQGWCFGTSDYSPPPVKMMKLKGLGVGNTGVVSPRPTVGLRAFAVVVGPFSTSGFEGLQTFKPCVKAVKGFKRTLLVQMKSGNP